MNHDEILLLACHLKYPIDSNNCIASYSMVDKWDTGAREDDTPSRSVDNTLTRG